jgi:uncharacterized membrane protein YhaH (DUF805 family)
MGLADVFLSFRGRLRRSSFGLASLGLICAFAGLFALMDAAIGRGSTLVLYPAFYWAALALCTKRLHDRGKSPFWLFLLLIPILGPLWTAIELALFRGTRGANRYGPDPRQVGLDYRTVS